MPDAQKIVQAMDDGLRATSYIVGQHSVATGWSADLTTQPNCTAEEPMKTSQHRQQIGCRSSPACRIETCAPRGTLNVRRVAASEPLSSLARPPAGLARSWTATSATMPKAPQRSLHCVREKVKRLYTGKPGEGHENLSSPRRRYAFRQIIKNCIK